MFEDYDHSKHVKALLDSLEFPEDQHFANTPARFVKFLMEFNQPFKVEEVLGTAFDVSADFHSMVVQTNIPFRALCAHHLAPFLGHAHVGYIPRRKVVGLSKLARLVHAVSHELPGIQEEMCDRIVDLLWTTLDPVGAICVISAEHGCMSARGIAEPGVATTTASVRGAFRDHNPAREEFYQIVRLNQNRG